MFAHESSVSDARRAAFGSIAASGVSRALGALLALGAAGCAASYPAAPVSGTTPEAVHADARIVDPPPAPSPSTRDDSRFEVAALFDRLGPLPGYEPTPIRTVEDDFTPASGPFLGLSVVRMSIDGDFDGNSALVSGNGQTQIALPNIDPAFGPRFAAGWRFRGGAIEIAYQHTEHDYDVGAFNDDATLDLLDINGRIYLPSFAARVKPNILVGACFPHLELDNASTDIQNNVGKGTLTGYGFNLGGGFDCYFTPNWSLDVFACYRWIRYTHAKGVSGGTHSIDNDDEVNGNGWTIGLGMAWTF